MIIDYALARRLETAEAADGACCAEAEWVLTPHSDAAVKPVAGGFVLFLGQTSPLTHALAIGMHGPVTAAELDEIEEFFEHRESAVAIDLCPFADPSLRELLAERRYRLSEFANVMVRHLRPEAPLPECRSDCAARPTGPLDIETWSDTLVRGFFGRDTATDDERHLGRVLFSMPGACPYIAEVGDEAIGGGSMCMRNGVASLFGDAVLPAYRRRGAHAALILARLQAALAAGCDIATAGTSPGSISQFNYQRMGFEIAYTKATMLKD